ncbi:T9SS type A sorting domain-containing protein [Pontibacter ruber]|uniref:T9SS type A sorting domain-containing protein n=1 Tax=Pontibacter ruber TaxID=1343895 RepID=A0ABW5CYV0_9BACT|nr:T9SS type A sorting domain-containing protein [Pontibacter ruber]
MSTNETGNILDCDIKEVKIEARAIQGDIEKEVENVVAYNWSGPNGFSSTQKIVTVTEPGMYNVAVTLATGAIARNGTEILGYNYPEKFAGPDKVLLPTRSTVQLDGYSNKPSYYSYSWEASQGGNIVSGANTLNPLVDAPGTYTITLTSPSGCTMQDDVVVTYESNLLEAQVWSNNMGGFDCNTTSADLVGYAYFNGKYVTEGVTFQWSGPDNFTANTKDTWVKAPGTYTLLVTHIATGETATASWTFAGPKLPVASAGPDKKLTCANPTVRLEGTVQVGDRVIWLASDGGNIVSDWDKLNPLVDAPGTYTMIISFYTSTCTAKYTVKVTREDILTVSATGGKLDCTKGSIQLMGSSNTEGVTYSWAGPNGYTSTEQNPTVKVAGDYTLTVTDPETGCTASTSVAVTPAATELEVTHHMIDFNGQKRGLITSIDTEAGPVALIGRKRNADGNYAPENYAAIFDSQDPTADDANLYTVDWAEVLIINQKQDNLPDANQWGGELILDFSAIGPVTMESMKVVGMDDYEQMSWIYLYDAEGKELNKVYLKPLGINSKQTVQLGNTKGVVKMKVVMDGRNGSGHFSGSAAIDDIKFHKETVSSSPCTTEAVNFTHAVAYPTSFSDKAKIEFIVRETENYTIDLYDTQGMLIKKLDAGTARAGEMTTVELNGSELKEGMYLARLVSASGSKTFKLILKR